jgi:cellulose biosynthesis protein BcsQ
MESQTKFVAISNQKGGVGKSAFTVLLAGYFHYLKGKNVLVVDCDYLQAENEILIEKLLKENIDDEGFRVPVNSGKKRRNDEKFDMEKYV